jgi:diadenosine tetraphosphate (Ap4A) HIT family hydrolase
MEREMVGSDSKQGCRFCEIGAGSAPDCVADLPWATCPGYVAFVSLGALAPGWSLVAPKGHRLNLADDYAEAAFHSFVTSCAASLRGNTKFVAAFEHGCTTDVSLTGCGTAHAHLHLVPLDLDLEALAQSYDPELEWIPARPAAVAGIANGSEYLFVMRDASIEEGLIAILKCGRSQFFRRVIARALGREIEFDYREYPQLDVVNASAVRLISESAC